MRRQNLSNNSNNRSTTSNNHHNHNNQHTNNHDHNYKNINNSNDGDVAATDNDSVAVDGSVVGGSGSVGRGGGGGGGVGGGISGLKVDPRQVHSILWLPVVIVCATTVLYALSRVFLGAVGNSHQIKFPTSIEDIQNMTEFLQSAQENHPYHLLMLFSAAYVYKQTFAVPGSVFLNLLAGALFGPYQGFVLTCTLTAIGATCCFLLSRTFGMAHVIKYFPDRVRYFQEKVESNGDSLFFFLLFLRLFPMTPNWAINMISPIVGVPIHLFFLSVLIGLMPYNFICVQTGDVLSQISSVNDVLGVWTMAKMAAVALVALAPGVAIKWFKIKQN